MSCKEFKQALRIAEDRAKNLSKGADHDIRIPRSCRYQTIDGQCKLMAVAIGRDGAIVESGVSEGVCIKTGRSPED